MKEINKESQVESELLDELLMGETIIYNTDDEPTGIYEANINEDNYFAWWMK